MNKSIQQLLAEMDAMSPGAAGSPHKRPADQMGNGEPPRQQGMGADPATGMGGGDAQANRPADQRGNGEDEEAQVRSPTTVVGSGEGTPMDMNQHWDEFMAMVQAGAHGTSTMKESDYLVKFDRKDFGNLFESEGLSEEFINKAGTLFEAAVNEKVRKIVESVNTNGRKFFVESTKTAVNALKQYNEENVSRYLDSVVFEWAKENTLAIENGAKVHLAESFMQGLTKLFAEHNVYVKNGRTDLLDEMAKEVTALKTQLAESAEKNATLFKNLKEAARDVEILEFTANMTAVKADKIKSLAEGVIYETPTQFREKLKVISESLDSKPAAKGNDSGLLAEDNGKQDAAPAQPVRSEIPEMERFIRTTSHLGNF